MIRLLVADGLEIPTRELLQAKSDPHRPVVTGGKRPKADCLPY
jgi:hypothetical protein